MSPSSVNCFGEVLKWERFVCMTVNERIYPSGSSVVVRVERAGRRVDGSSRTRL